MKFILFDIDSVLLYEAETFEEFVHNLEVALKDSDLLDEFNLSEILRVTYSGITILERDNLWDSFTKGMKDPQIAIDACKNFKEGFDRVYPDQLELCAQELKDCDAMIETYGIENPFETETETEENQEDDKWMEELLKNPVGTA